MGSALSQALEKRKARKAKQSEGTTSQSENPRTSSHTVCLDDFLRVTSLIAVSIRPHTKGVRKAGNKPSALPRWGPRIKVVRQTQTLKTVSSSLGSRTGSMRSALVGCTAPTIPRERHSLTRLLPVRMTSDESDERSGSDA